MFENVVWSCNYVILFLCFWVWQWLENRADHLLELADFTYILPKLIQACPNDKFKKCIFEIVFFSSVLKKICTFSCFFIQQSYFWSKFLNFVFRLSWRFLGKYIFTSIGDQYAYADDGLVPFFWKIKNKSNTLCEIWQILMQNQVLQILVLQILTFC